MTTKDAIKHLSHKISYYKAIDEKWADSVSIDALEIAVRAMAEERKKGEWLRDPPEGGYALYKCSVCGECWLHWWASAMTVEKMTKEVRCCPHCGAEMVSNMRGDGNETN